MKNSELTSKFQTVEDEKFRGEPCFLAEGEQITGVYLGPGRTIGEGDKSTETIEILDLDEVDGVLKILPAHTMLESKIKEIDGIEAGKTVLEITFKGKVEGKNNQYNDYRVRARIATSGEVALAGVMPETATEQG